MEQLPAWVGWPGGGVPPGHDWLPGPMLRGAGSFLVYGGLALALTVNYAASLTFFLLAILGMYIGLRRGFVNGLTKAEKLVMIVFAAYPIVAIASYQFGTQTDVGFRFLGRDLRFLLFVPVYVAARWSALRSKRIGWALTLGALGACIEAFLQSKPWPAPTPHGVAGTHITFGDLALLSGFLGAVLAWPLSEYPGENGRGARRLRWGLVGLSVIAGVMVSVLAHSRGAWLAIPVILIYLGLTLPTHRFGARRVRLLLVVVAMIACVGASLLVPKVRYQIDRAQRDLTAYMVASSPISIHTPCVDRKDFLRTLLRFSSIKGTGSVHVVELSPDGREAISHWGCNGRFAIRMVNPSANRKPLHLALYRGNGVAPRRLQAGVVLARGVAGFKIGWKGQWAPIDKSSQWATYRNSASYALVRRANLRVTPGHEVLVIPMQVPRAAFAYPLADSSVGHRLAMWQSAAAMFISRPWLGWGAGSFQARSKETLGEQFLARLVGRYEHAHSDYMTSLATKGVLGLIVLFGLLAAPLIGALPRFNGTNSSTALRGAMTLTIGMAIFGLTETMFVHSLVISWYCVVVAAVVVSNRNSRSGVRISKPSRVRLND